MWHAYLIIEFVGLLAALAVAAVIALRVSRRKP